jgi:hypothetical protein
MTVAELWRFCASTVTWPHEPIGFSHLRYALSGSIVVRVARGCVCEHCVNVKQIVRIHH